MSGSEMVSTPNDHCQRLQLEQNLDNIFEMSVKHSCDNQHVLRVFLVTNKVTSHVKSFQEVWR